MSENLVICPNCVHQFRAISVSDQERIAKLQAVVEAAKHLVSKYGDELMHRCDVDALEQALKEVES